MLSSVDRIKEERKKAKNNRNKYVGSEGGGGGGGSGGFSGSGSKYGGFGSDSYFDGKSLCYSSSPVAHVDLSVLRIDPFVVHLICRRIQRWRKLWIIAARKQSL